MRPLHKPRYQREVLQRMVTACPSANLKSAKLPETSIVSCICALAAGTTVIWTFLHQWSQPKQRRSGSPAQNQQKSVDASGSSEPVEGDALPCTDELYSCISRLITSKAIDKALLMEQVRAAEERALLAEKGKEEVSSSIQGAVEAAAELADEITQAVARAEARAEEYRLRWKGAELKLQQLKLQVASQVLEQQTASSLIKVRT
eukprot:jgi/Botrbrau1/4394/Bobra.105_2s0040.1